VYKDRPQWDPTWKNVSNEIYATFFMGIRYVIAGIIKTK